VADSRTADRDNLSSTRCYLRLLFRLVGWVFLRGFLGFFAFGFLGFAAGCAAAGAAGAGFAASGEAVNENRTAATIAAPCQILFTRIPPPERLKSRWTEFILAPAERGRNRNFAAHRHSITDSGRTDEDVKSTREV
jgi:hypothetical protein